MASKHKDIGQMFKDNILRVCFWSSTTLAALTGIGAAKNLADGNTEDAKTCGKIALWSLVADAVTMGAAALTGKKLGLKGGKDVSFEEINTQMAIDRKDRPTV